jgi:hypothetical protein
MPLRDHFRPPVSKRSSWEGFHGGWPMRIVEELAPRLPDGFVAEPRVHLGNYYEIDICAFEQREEGEPVFSSTAISSAVIGKLAGCCGFHEEKKPSIHLAAKILRSILRTSHSSAPVPVLE